MGKKKLRKTFEIPKKIWDKQRIDRDKKLREEYGLRSARELWKMQTKLRKLRREAREILAGKGKGLENRKKQLFDRVKSFLIRKQDLTLDDVLSIDVTSVLERRLETVVLRKRLAKTIRQARQFITHGHISVDGKKIASPSYFVKFGEEDKVSWYGNPLTIEASVKEETAEEKPVEAKQGEKGELIG